MLNEQLQTTLAIATNNKSFHGALGSQLVTNEFILSMRRRLALEGRWSVIRNIMKGPVWVGRNRVSTVKISFRSKMMKHDDKVGRKSRKPMAELKLCNFRGKKKHS